MTRNALLLALLFAASVASAQDSARSLAEIQDRLNELGYEAGVSDGVMGAATAKAIRNFQRVVGLEPTGIPNALLESHLFRGCAIELEMGEGFSFTGHPQGGCFKPEHYEGLKYKVCTREGGDCSVPGPNGVTDSLYVDLKEQLE